MPSTLKSRTSAFAIAGSASNDFRHDSLLVKGQPDFKRHTPVSLIGEIDASWANLFMALESESTNNGSELIATIQRPAIEGNKTICDLAMDSVSKLPASHQKNLANSLLVAIRRCIMSKSIYAERTPFCPISFSIDDDGSLILEWAYRNGRISYYIDPVISESTAVFVDALMDGWPPKTWSKAISVDKVSELAADSVSFIARLA